LFISCSMAHWVYLYAFVLLWCPPFFNS